MLFRKGTIQFFIAIILLMVILESCRVTQTSNTILDTNQSEIVFIVMKISRDSLKKQSNIQIINKIKTPGTFKNNDRSSVVNPNFLTMEVNNNGNVVHTFVLEHPLYKVVEYSDGDKLMAKQLKLDEEEFYVRLQSNDASTELKIYETLSGVSKTLLTSIKL